MNRYRDLSTRQREILGHILDGLAERDIAKALHRSVHTVHTHVRQIYSAFDVSSRGELMALFVDKAVLADVKDLPSLK